MIRFLLPIFFIGISVTTFFMLTDPIYKDISKLKLQSSSYNEALGNSKALENERDKLTAKYNTISQDNLNKIQKLLPDNIDNIRLILEIEKIASPYGITLKDIKYDASEKKSDTASKTTPSAIVGASPVSAQSGTKGYGIWDLEFSTTSTYDNFMSFTKDLESNLRIVDISSISFSSDSVSSVGLATSAVSGKDVYKYDFKIKTYWLKN